jgi:hypothetical protein
MNPTARTPFRFCARLSLTLLTGRKAASLEELVEGLKAVPDSVVYQHTHRYLYQHQFLVPEPPNDFAYWTAHMLGNEELGERLAAVDTVRFNTLAGLREALLAVLEKELAENEDDRRVPEGKEFHFMGAVRFSVPTPHVARDLAEFCDQLKVVSISSLYLHIFEARLRPPLGINDFSYWFETELDLPRLAKKVSSLDPYTQTLEGLRSKIVRLVEEELSYGQA